MSGQVQRRNAQMVELARSEFPRSPWGCAFLAFNTATDVGVTGSGVWWTADFNSEVFDLGDDFAADTFTAPVTGTYLLHANVTMTALDAAHTRGLIQLITSNRTYYGTHVNIGAARELAATRYAMLVTALVDMDAADTAIARVYVSGGGVGSADVLGDVAILYTYFCGHRVS